MDLASIIVLIIYGGGFMVIVGILTYLLVRRLRIKKTEDFEEREN